MKSEKMSDRKSITLEFLRLYGTSIVFNRSNDTNEWIATVSDEFIHDALNHVKQVNEGNQNDN